MKNIFHLLRIQETIPVTLPERLSQNRFSHPCAILFCVLRLYTKDFARQLIMGGYKQPEFTIFVGWPTLGLLVSQLLTIKTLMPCYYFVCLFVDIITAMLILPII